MKQWAKLLFISLFAFSTNNILVAGKITLRIYTHNATHLDFGTVYEATLEGFDYKKNQVSLVPNVMSTQFRLPPSIEEDGIERTPEQCKQELTRGTIKRYPLHFHKKINFLAPDDHLEIVRMDTPKNASIINLPAGMADRLLHYLADDIETDSHDCYHFWQQLLGVSVNKSIITTLIQAEEIEPDANTAKPGEGLAWGNQTNHRILDDYTMLHFAISLGNGLAISKLGNKNFIRVHDIRSMLAIYQCEKAFKTSL